MSEARSVYGPRAQVAVVRHGQEAGAFGAGDPGLSPLGKEQALAAARELRDQRWRAVLASPATRTVETARIIAGELGLKASTDRVFAELRPPASIAEPRSVWQRRILDLPWEQVPQELHGWRDQLVQRIQEVAVDTVIVTHFGVINAIASTICGSETFFVFAPRPGSITRLTVNWNQSLCLEKLGLRSENPAKTGRSL